jgi:hypothetical protein
MFVDEVELFVENLLVALLPTEEEISEKVIVLDWLNSIFTNCFVSKSFYIGAELSKVLLPSEITEVSHILPKGQLINWSHRAYDALNAEFTKPAENDSENALNPDFSKIHVDLISVTMKKYDLKLSINQSFYKVSPNNVRSIYMTAMIEEVDQFIANKNLFKRSLLFIKAWCSYESRRFFFKCNISFFFLDEFIFDFFFFSLIFDIFTTTKQNST